MRGAGDMAMLVHEALGQAALRMAQIYEHEKELGITRIDEVEDQLEAWRALQQELR